MSDHLIRAQLADDEQPEDFKPGDLVYFRDGVNPTPNRLIEGIVINPSANILPYMEGKVAIRPLEPGWPNDVYRLKSDIVKK